MSRRRRMILGAAGLAAAGLLTGGVLLAQTPPLSAACRADVTAQNTYVQYALGQGYPNVDLYTGMAIMATDTRLLERMTQDHCPSSTRVDVLPS